MKLSYWIMGMADWPLSVFVERAKELGYAGIDLRITTDGQLNLTSSDTEIDAVARTFEGSGVEIASLLCYNQRGNGTKPMNWKKLEEELISLARLSTKLNNRQLRIAVGTPDPETGWGTYLRNLGHVAQVASQEVPQAELAFANHFGSASAEQLFKLCEEIDNPRIGVIFSPDHCIVMQERPDLLACQYSHLIKQVCLADRRLNEHGLFESCMYGEGVVPVAAILEQLSAKGWDGFLSLKWEKNATAGLHLGPGELVLEPYVQFMRSQGLLVGGRA